MWKGTLLSIKLVVYYLILSYSIQALNQYCGLKNSFILQQCRRGQKTGVIRPHLAYRDNTFLLAQRNNDPSKKITRDKEKDFFQTEVSGLFRS